MLTNRCFKLLYKPINTVCLHSLINTTRIAFYTTEPKEIASSENPTIATAQFLLNYKPEQIEKILNTINNSNLEHLLRYEISKTPASKLQSWVRRNGPIQRSQDLLEIDGLSVKILQKFCNSVLSEKTNEHGQVLAKISRPRNVSFVTPSVSETQRQQIRTCVSVRIGVSSVSWARLELPDENQVTPCLLTDWQHHEISEKKLHLNDLIQRCLYIDHLIPTADCYLFENPQMAQISTNPGNADQQNINIQKAQITAVLSFALSARRFNISEEIEENTDFQTVNNYVPTEEKPIKSKVTKNQETLLNVFYLRRFLTARLFKHLIGTERVSSEQTVTNLMRTYYNVDQLQDVLEDNDTDAEERFSFRGNVQFPQELRQMFSRAEPYQREFLGQALLLNLTFVRLILLQDANSIALVTRDSNKKVELTS